MNRFLLRCGLVCLALVFSVAVLVVGLLPQSSSGQNQQAAAHLQIKKGDQISIIGNTLAERMQHDGWLETYLYSRFPQYKLVIRNLGYSGDELTQRLRSRDFGSPDQWLSGSAPNPRPRGVSKNAPVSKNRFHLTKLKTDVLFAFFGYSESFAGKKGLPKFKTDLANFIKHTRSQRYNGKSAPRLVLFSPIAHENLKDPNLPDGSANNKRLAMYTKAMAEVAKEHNVPFVDLFQPSKKAYDQAAKPLTINGVHLNSAGNEEIAKAIDKSLFPMGPQPKRSTELLAKLRKAVVDKNFFWFNRYRTVDGYSTYGVRAFLKFNGQTNYEVLQRELENLDVMTRNRDRVVWAIAESGGAKSPVPNDNNTAPYISVETNKPGKGAGGKHLFLDGETAMKQMKLGKNLNITLFASEKEFPELASPVQMAFDTKGRLWVAAWPTYPHWQPKEPMNDKLLIFEDTDRDGKADKMKVFADNLHNPTGFEFWNGGVLVAHAPDLLFLKDTDGDDKADVRTRVIGGVDSADTHHTINSFTLDPGGALYMQEGTFHHTQVETPWGPTVRSANAGVFRYEPRSHKFDVYVNFGFANPHGHVFDRWGQDIVVDGTGAVPYHGTLFSGQTANFRQRHGRPPTVYKRKTRPCGGIEYLSSRHFPKEMQGNLLVSNVIGFLGILQYKIVDDGSSLKGIEVEPIVQSRDPNFRPVDIEMGPDGAIYFVDWQNPIIGHMQHNLRDPSRDRVHGRIYKITYKNRPLLKPAKIDGAPIPKLLELLKSPEDRTRYRTRIELGERDTGEVIAGLKTWTAALDPKDKDYEHHMLETLWLHQNHNVVNQSLLERMLRSPNFRARAAATRVLCYWRDRVREPLQLLRRQVNDSHPRVRLEAIRALSFFGDEEALGTALEILAHPQDRYISYTFNETLRTFENRLGTGLNRRNFAASLVKMLNKENLDEQRKSALVETICEHGGGKELNAIWQQARTKGNYSPNLRRHALVLLAEAAAHRQTAPKVNAGDVRSLLMQASKSEKRLLPSAIRLAVAWKVKETADQLQLIAQSGKDLNSRFAAIDGLAAFADAATLKKLSATAGMPVRFRAAVALANIDGNAGAAAAADAIAAAKEKDDVAPVIDGFLIRKNGPEMLAAALKTRKISDETAKRLLRAMYLAGRNDPPLADVIGKFAGLDATPKPPTPEQVKELSALVLAKGKAPLGEHVFRRMDLGCMKCHAVHKAGGDIGPDLGPIGGTSPMDYIITSILDPNHSIKEEYLTKSIVTKKGQVLQGIVIERNNNRVLLKNAKGERIQVPAKDIVQEVKGKSLMPEGVTRILTKTDLYHLIRFVAELGKPGPYRVSPEGAVRNWRKLSAVPDSLKKGIPNREVVREALLSADPDAWETLYGLVDGGLPLSKGVQYLQSEINVTRGGQLNIAVNAGSNAVFWIDEEPFAKNNAAVKLAAGRHRITVRLESGGKMPPLRVAVRSVSGSTARFELARVE